MSTLHENEDVLRRKMMSLEIDPHCVRGHFQRLFGRLVAERLRACSVIEQRPGLEFNAKRLDRVCDLPHPIPGLANAQQAELERTPFYLMACSIVIFELLVLVLILGSLMFLLPLTYASSIVSA